MWNRKPGKILRRVWETTCLKRLAGYGKDLVINMAVISYKCPNCDGELIFDPSTQKYKCEYCSSFFGQTELDDMNPSNTQERKTEEKTSGTPKGQSDTEDAVIYNCPSCGAQIVTDATTAATYCYYCHNPVVLSGRLAGEFLPDKVIPFTIDRKQAESSFLSHVHSKKFVPRAFFNKKQIEKLSGVYFPYWMFDCDLKGQLSARAAKVRVWRSGDTEYTETKHYQIEREGDISLNDITRNALQKANHKLIDGVMPYDFQKKQEFHMGYLSGFLAEKRDIGQKELAAEVKQEAGEYGKRLLSETIGGYSNVSIKDSSFHHTKESWSYVLLPVWTVTYRSASGKTFYYSMNGQTGKVYGELPIDFKKLCLLGGIIALAVFAICLIVGYLV